MASNDNWSGAGGTLSAWAAKPQGVDYSGGSGIYLPAGQEIGKQQIADYFNTNPTNQDIGKYAGSLGLNSSQVQNALAQWKGQDYQAPIWDPAGAATIGGSAGGSGTEGSNNYSGATGAWGGGRPGASGPGAPMGGSSNLGFGGGGGSYGGSSSSSSGGQNPYLSAMANDIGRRSNQALGTALQGIRGNSVATGGLGGSRQGVAEGTAIGNAQDTLQGNLSNLYGTDWTNGQNRNLQYYNTNTNAALTNQGQNQSFYTQNRQLDQSGMALGANLYGQGNAGLIGQGQGVYGIGNTQQNAQWGVINNANGAISPYTGYGATNTQTGQSGGGASGVVGGALAGAQIGKNLGLGGTGSGFVPYNNNTTIPMQPGGGY